MKLNWGPLGLPREHGSWVLFGGPAFLGTMVAGAVRPATLVVWVGGLLLFLMRGSLERVIGSYAGRSSQRFSASPWGQLVGTAALAFMAPATFVASGGTATGGIAAGRLVAGLWVLATVGFGLGVMRVQVLVKWVRVAAGKFTPRVRAATSWWLPVAGAGAMVLVWWLGRAGWVPRGVYLALVPGVVHAIWTCACGRRETRFKRVGQVETAFALVFITLVKVLW